MFEENLPILAAFQKKPRNLPHDTTISPIALSTKFIMICSFTQLNMLIHKMKYAHSQNEIPPNI